MRPAEAARLTCWGLEWADGNLHLPKGGTLNIDEQGYQVCIHHVSIQLWSSVTKFEVGMLPS